ncbi:hypothetical protein MMC06_001709 [Schaereria dolodes]|nr:hypothetical protein [Schaereria dolodes]
MRAAIKVRLSPSKLCLLGNGAAGSASIAARRGFATSEKRRTNWGFIGLGQMGYPMAKNLRNKIADGDTMVVHDRNVEATRQFVEEVGTKGVDVQVVGTPREVAEKCTTIITVLPDSSHVNNVFHNILEPALKPSNPERLFIDCSTIDPASSREVANAVHCTAQGRFVDAPMSGGVVGARASTLSFMLGASSRTGQLTERVKPILMLMGKRVFHLGEQGSGLSGKLANNYLLAVSNIATAEAMNFGVKRGLDPQKLGELINTSSGRCWSSEINNPIEGVSNDAPANRGYEGGFSVKLMKKDLKLAMSAANEVGAKLELADKALDVYEAAADTDGNKDFSVVYKLLNKDA